MSSDDQQFIEELTAWLGPEGETREARKQLLARDRVVSVNTLTQILKGRYNASEKLRTNLRNQMAVLDTIDKVSPQAAKAASG
jgi:hypothetical protein